ncbi:MAG: restriction endonuclease, partial [Chlorobia bacterium]|nr:restriction endonuclease [Fimbriimonadaceae bacterium]
MPKRLSKFEHPESMPLSELLRLRLAWLSYLEFAMCVSRILRHLGYTDIPVPSRLSFKGPNADGGVDLRARKITELGSEPVLIQLKRYKDDNRPVSRSAVDEFRGKLLRDAVPEG